MDAAYLGLHCAQVAQYLPVIVSLDLYANVRWPMRRWIGCIGHGNDIGGSVRYPAYAYGVHGVPPCGFGTAGPSGPEYAVGLGADGEA